MYQLGSRTYGPLSVRKGRSQRFDLLRLSNMGCILQHTGRERVPFSVMLLNDIPKILYNQTLFIQLLHWILFQEGLKIFRIVEQALERCQCFIIRNVQSVGHCCHAFMTAMGKRGITIHKRGRCMKISIHGLIGSLQIRSCGWPWWSGG